MASAADLLIRVSADTAAAVTSMNSLKGSVDSVGAAMGGASSSGFVANLNAAAPAATAFAAAGALIVGALGLATKTAADFESSLSAVKSVMAPADVLKYGDTIRTLALQLGGDAGLSVSASGATDAIGEMIKAGMPIETVLNGGARAAIALANATGISFGEAGQMAANVMNAFQIKASAATSTMDWMAGVVNATAADMNDLKYGMASVGTVAHQIGLSFQDTALAIGIFANAGLRGQDAGTSLKTMLINLTPSTDKQRDAMEKLGIITKNGTNLFFDQSGKVKDLAGIHDVLYKALSGLTEQQRIQAVQQIFGTDAMRAALIVYGTSRTEIDGLRDSVSQMTVADMAAERMDNFNGVLEAVKGTLESAAIVIGDKFLPGLTSLVKTAGSVLTAFLNLPEPVQTLIALVAGAAGGFLALTGGAVLLGPRILEVVAALGPMAATLGALLVPLALVAAAVGVFYLAWQGDWGGIRETITSIGDVLSGLFQLVTGGNDAFGTLYRGLTALFGSETALSIITWVANITNTFNGLKAAVADLLRTGDLSAFVAQVQSLTGIDLSGFLNLITNISTLVQDLLTANLSKFVSDFQAMTGINLQGFVNLVTNLSTLVGDLVSGNTAKLVSDFEGMTGINLQPLVNFLSWVSYYADLIFKGNWSQLIADLRTFQGIDLQPIVNLLSWVSHYADLILKGNWSQIVTDLKTFQGIDLSGIVDFLSKAWMMISNLVSGKTDLQGFAAQLLIFSGIDLTGLAGTIERVWNAVSNLLSGKTDLQTFVAQIAAATGIDLSGLVNFLDKVWMAVSNLLTGKTDWEGFVNQLKIMQIVDLGPITKFVQDLASAVGSLLQGDTSSFVQKIKDMSGLDLSGFVSVLGKVVDAAKALWSGDLTAFNGKIKELVGLDLGPFEGLISKVASAVGSLIGGDLTSFNAKIKDLTGIDLLPLEVDLSGIASAIGSLIAGDLTAFNGKVKEMTGIDLAPFEEKLALVRDAATDILAGDWTKLVADLSKLTTLDLSAGITTAKDVYKTASDAIVTLKDSAIAFGNWLGTDTGKFFLGFFGTIAVEMGGYAIATWAAALATTALNVSLGALAVLAGIFSAPVTGVIAVFALLVAAIGGLYASNPEFKKSMDTMVANLGTAMDNIGKFVSGIPDAIASVPRTISGIFAQIGAVITDFLYGKESYNPSGAAGARTGGLLTPFLAIKDNIQGIIDDVGKIFAGDNPLQALFDLLDRIGKLIGQFGFPNPFGWLVGLVDLLPDWLTPGSPTPLENALTGAAGGIGLIEALRLLGTLNPFGWLLGIGAEGIKTLTGIFGGGGGGGGSGSGTGPITVYGPLVSIGGTNASAGEIVAAIQDAFEMLAGGGPETAVATPGTSGGSGFGGYSGGGGGGGGGGSW